MNKEQLMELLFSTKNIIKLVILNVQFATVNNQKSFASFCNPYKVCILPSNEMLIQHCKKYFQK